VLPRQSRLTSPSDFARTTKSGIRVTSQNFVGYLYIQPAVKESARAGLIIGKSVGGSVYRHRLSRQVRHAIAPHLTKLPEGSLLVIRAIKGSESIQVIPEITEMINSLVKRSEKFLAAGAQ
jgi:ribonuclease P protein component